MCSVHASQQGWAVEEERRLPLSLNERSLFWAFLRRALATHGKHGETRLPWRHGPCSPFSGSGVPGGCLGLFLSSRLVTVACDPSSVPVQFSSPPSHAALEVAPCFLTPKSSSASDFYFLQATSQAVFLEMLLRNQRT